MRAALFALVVLVPLAARADGEWEKATVKKGVTYDRRSVTGSKFYEYRGTVVVERAAEGLLDALWAHVVDLKGPQVTKRDVVRKDENEIVLHDEIKTPVVSDRELTLLFWKQKNPTLGLYFTIRNDLWPRPNPKWVQLPMVRGGWTLEPIDATHTRLVYTCYSEPGGSVPAWMVRGAQADQVVKDVELGLIRIGMPAR